MTLLNKNTHTLFILNLLIYQLKAQVCAPIGELCTATEDCCKGCCESNGCIDKEVSCRIDMVEEAGVPTCLHHFCPPHYICFLHEICQQENPCFKQPRCRKITKYDKNDEQFVLPSSEEIYQENDTNPVVSQVSFNSMANHGCYLYTLDAILPFAMLTIIMIKTLDSINVAAYI